MNSHDRLLNSRRRLLCLFSACLGILACIQTRAASISSGETLAGRIEGPGAQVRYDFSASVGNTITVAVGETVPGNFRPSITLYGPDGAELGWSSGDTGTSVTGRATLNGNHYAIVEDYWASYDGNYRFTMVKVPGAQADTDGRLVQSGETVTGTLPVGDVDVFTIAASAGNMITVAVGETVPGNFRPSITLYGPDGAELGWSSGDTGASVTGRATLNGNHYAVVEDYFASYDGNYRFTLSGTITPPTDLTFLTPLRWNTIMGGLDFSYTVQGGAIINSTTAKLFWASGTTVANILSSTPIFTQNIPTGFSGPSATIHVPANSFPEEPPTGATYLLLFLDPDNTMSESSEENNVAFIAPEAVNPLTTIHTAPPSTSLSLLEANLQTSVLSFRNAVLAIPGTTFNVTSTYRPLAYQQHLYEMRTKFLELWKVRGVKSYKLAEGAKGRPQLQITPGTPSMLVNDIVKAVNSEIRTHTLIPGSPNLAPAVNPPEESLHSESPSRAVDIAISGISDARKLTLAKVATLYRPNPGDLVHFARVGTPATANTTQAAIQGNSPINLLVTDPAGHKLGFDSTTGQEVNELGPFAEYSGTNTEPQVLILPAGVILSGGYTVTGVGTGEGSYSISLHLRHEDPENEEPEILLAAGVAHLGVPLAAVQTMDLTNGVPRLFIEQLAQGSLIYWPAFATNYTIEQTGSLNPGNWASLSNSVDYVNQQLVITNYVGTAGFFRLRLQP